MGFFSLKAVCGVCGKDVGLNRYKVNKDNAWCCPDCFKKAQKASSQPLFIQKTTIEELKSLVEGRKMQEEKEYRMHCNVCGHIYCFKQSDLDRNAQKLKQAKREGAAAALNALGGSSYHMYEQKKAMESSISAIVDYSKCPNCNSTSVAELSEEEFKALQSKKSSAPVAALSNADELKKYKDLLDSGIISQEEFDAKKKQLLGL